MDRPKTTAKDFFVYLGTMVLLYVSFGSLLTLLFNYINYLFPDPLVERYVFDPYSSAIRFSLAILIILFPVFWLANWYVNRDIRTNPEKQEIGIRKWLLYLTLFAAVAIIIGDLVVLVNTFLNGEITTRFILKVLSVLILSGLALSYYWLDLRGAYIERPILGRSFGIAAAVIVLGSVVGGFFIIGSPASQRLIRFDQQKVNDLANIQSQVVNFWQAKERLPQSLDELRDPVSGIIIPADPQLNQPYEYAVRGSLNFSLCADFNKEGSSYGTYYNTSLGPVGKVPGVAEDNWTHGLGRVCFDRTIDPERYPPF